MTYSELKDIQNYAEDYKDKSLLQLIELYENTEDAEELKDLESEIEYYWENILDLMAGREDDKGDYLYCLANNK